ncbi:hypothetical protein CC80DRAFT_539036 [Byssothecium circinans]|uniref:Uncharacterized protein n=1 Tax=Byssothecium circinans TaxID=147558 RepID=A0A6A5TEZ9_9PLEO|nr:hypothetical protein CC80DRAFT_539036 [Byssothecium circinans]
MSNNNYNNNNGGYGRGRHYPTGPVAPSGGRGRGRGRGQVANVPRLPTFAGIASSGPSGGGVASSGPPGQGTATGHCRGRSVTPEGERTGAPLMRRPDAGLQPDLFYPPPGPYVSMVDLPLRTGNRKGDEICPHCLRLYSKEDDHTASRTCGDECGSCNTRDHQGRFCPRRYLSFNFYRQKLCRAPYEDERIQNIFPSAEDKTKLLRAGHQEFRKLADPDAAEETSSQQPPAKKRKTEDDGSPAETLEAIKTELGRMQQEVADMKKKMAERDEKIRVLSEQLRGRPADRSRAENDKVEEEEEEEEAVFKGRGQ